MTAAPEPLDAGRVDEAGRALARAFHDDPSFGWLWPDPRSRPAALAAFLAIPLADARRHGHADVVLDAGRVVAAAAWLPPGAHPMTARRQLATLPRVARMAFAAPRRAPAVAAFGNRLDRRFPADRPHYLQLIGVAPEAQGRGLGGALLEAGLARCDAAGEAAYLETATAAAARLYARHGFETLEPAAQLLPGGGPTHRLMRRPGA